MPFSLFNTGRAKVEKVIQSYIGWRVVDGFGRILGYVKNIDYKVEKVDGKTRIVIQGITVVGDGGAVNKYTVGSSEIEIDESNRRFVVKPKDELYKAVEKIERELSTIAGNLRNVNEKLLKLGDAILNMISRNEKIPEDVVENFRKILENERNRYIRECGSRLDGLSKLKDEVDARIRDAEEEYGNLRLRKELGMLSSEEEGRLNELRDRLNMLRYLRSWIIEILNKYRGECSG